MPQLGSQILQQIVHQKKFYNDSFKFGEQPKISMDPIKAAFEKISIISKTIENHSFNISANLMSFDIYKSNTLHCDNGPAQVTFITGNYHQEKIDRFDYSYRKNGKIHNDNGLPVEYLGNYYYDEDKYFYTTIDIYRQFGILHREDGPAYIKRHMDLSTGKVHIFEENFYAFDNEYNKDEFNDLQLSPKELEVIQNLEEKMGVILKEHENDFFDWPDDLPVLPKELIKKFNLSQKEHSIAQLPIVYQNNHKRKLMQYGYRSTDGGFIGHDNTNDLTEIRIVGSNDDIKIMLKYKYMGSLHRKDRPALIVHKAKENDKLLDDCINLKEEYYQYGFNHRENGPAITHRFHSGNLKLQEYRRHNLLHRSDGPARIKYHDNENNSIKLEEFYYLDQLHNLDKPARIKYNINGMIREKKWFIHGQEINTKFLKKYGVNYLKNYYARLGYKLPPDLIKVVENLGFYIHMSNETQFQDLIDIDLI